VQQQNDGTHAILPVATHLTCKVDHAGVPVMWLRHSHGKMRRDGFPAALMQHVRPVDERGRVHGASGLAAVVAHRVQAWRRGPCRRKERKREWLRWYATNDRLRGQVKLLRRQRSRRHVISNERDMPWRRAVDDIARGVSKLSNTIRSFSSSDQRRRRPVSTTSNRSVLRLWTSIRTVTAQST